MGTVKILLWPCNNWIEFLVQVIILAIAGMVVNYTVFMSKAERASISSAFARKVVKRK